MSAVDSSADTTPQVGDGVDSAVKQLFTLEEARVILDAERQHRRSKRPKREVETSEYIAAARRFIRAAGRRVADADDVELGQLVGLYDDLDAAVEVGALGIKTRGSWAYIGKALGISREAAYQKWGKK